VAYLHWLWGTQTADGLQRDIDAVSQRLEVLMARRDQLFAEGSAGFATEVTEDSAKQLEALDKEIRSLDQKAYTYGMLAADVAAYNAEMKVRNALEDQNAGMTAEAEAALQAKDARVRDLAQAEADRKEAEKAVREGDRESQQTDRIFNQADREILQLQQRGRAMTMNAAAAAGLAKEESILLAIRQQGREPTMEEIELARQKRIATEQQTKANEDLQKSLDQIKEFARDLESAFKKWADGSKLDVKDMVRSMLADLATLAFRQSLQGLGNALLPGIGSLLDGARADGGPVSAGGMYLVGERGPELFAPGTSGQIVPNHAMGGG